MNARAQVVSLDAYLQALVENVAEHLDLNRRLPRPAPRPRRSREEVLSLASDRWIARFYERRAR
jgi:hypothetical protein